VRQLRNAVERAAVLTGASAEIHLQDLPEEVRELPAAEDARGTATPAGPKPGRRSPDGPDDSVNFDAVVTKVERDLLLQSLAKSGGNKMRAAQMLGMKRTTFVEKLKRLGIEWEKETTDMERE
jgi:DNA-binding NtrC family response regulator